MCTIKKKSIALDGKPTSGTIHPLSRYIWFALTWEAGFILAARFRRLPMLTAAIPPTNRRHCGRMAGGRRAVSRGYDQAARALLISRDRALSAVLLSAPCLMLLSWPVIISYSSREFRYVGTYLPIPALPLLCGQCCSLHSFYLARSLTRLLP